MKRIVKDWDGSDVFTPWRRHYCWTQRAGACDKVKRRYRRWERRSAKDAIRRGAD